MTTSLITLTALVVATLTALAAALAGWYRTIDAHRSAMSGRSYLLSRYVAPPFMLLVASPVLDAAVLAAGGPFPVFGFPAVLAGLVGSVSLLGYVYVDVRTAAEESGTQDAGVEGRATA